MFCDYLTNCRDTMFQIGDVRSETHQVFTRQGGPIEKMSLDDWIGWDLTHTRVQNQTMF